MAQDARIVRYNIRHAMRRFGLSEAEKRHLCTNFSNETEAMSWHFRHF